MNDLWFKNAVFYEIAVRAFKDGNGDGCGDLIGIAEKIDYLRTLGADCIWLMPIYPSPLKDDGYDIADYCNVDPAYGDVADLKALIDACHAQGIRIIMDLVLNHTSDEHPWFKAARASRTSPYRDYYVWSDTKERFKEARVVFVDTEASNWTWDEQTGQYYWHRFYASQPDLNFDNPRVQEEMLNVARFWLDLGIDGFRADAVPYLFERESTSCENLPETHAYLKRLRAFIDEHYPGRILLCEANQWPEDVRPYFGDGDEFHMAFHFPLMPRVFMALGREEVGPIRWVLDRTGAIPPDCQWCTFLRNHDELTLEMVTAEEREWMWDTYAPEPRMRLNLGIRRRLAPLLDNHRQRIELANSLLFTLPGAPIVYYGDEIGMGDNLDLPDRNGVRTPMQWDATPGAGFSARGLRPDMVKGSQAAAHVNVASQMEDPHSLFHTLRTMIAVRKQHPAFGGSTIEWVDAGTPAIAAFLRRNGGEEVLVLSNLSHKRQSMALPAQSCGEYVDLFSSRVVSLGEVVELPPWCYMWLQRHTSDS